MCILAVLFFVLMPLCAFAQRDPTIGSDQFPQFRNLSGLAGTGYGVDSQGYSSLCGPTAFSTPVAYVLGHDQWRFGTAKTCFTGWPAISSNRTNGTTFGTFGHTFGRFNVAVTDMLLSAQSDQAFHTQIQYIPSAQSRWVGSVGVQDAGGGGGSAGTGLPGDSRSSRSAFAVVTYRADTGRAPLYLSAGIGTRRFKRPFGSASYQVIRPLRVWIEHDGFGVNAGVLWTWQLARGRKAVEWSVLMGLQKERFFTFSTGVGF